MLLTLKDEPHPTQPEEFSNADLLAYGGRRWRRVQHLADQFWNRWRQGYMQSLQSRSKWNKERTSLKLGDLVLLRDKSAPRNSWPSARVVHVKISKDGLVRSATVEVVRTIGNQLRKSAYNRPVCELVLLMPSTSTNWGGAFVVA